MTDEWRERGRAGVRAVGRTVVTWVLVGLVVAVATSPLALEKAIEDTRLDDRLGAVPVQVSLARNGVTTLDTGVLGRIYWQRTGRWGLGATVRITGPPLAEGTLSSYVTPTFVRAHSRLLEDPGGTAQAYGRELTDQVLERTLLNMVVLGAGGALLVLLVTRGRAPFARWTPGRRALARTGLAVAVAAAATAGAGVELARWPGSKEPEVAYPLPGQPGLLFSSPQTLEVARQVQPFVEKNVSRVRERAAAFEDATTLALAEGLPRHADDLQPRPGEVVVIAEADPQGSLVATAVRSRIYAALLEVLDPEQVVLRTIAGDVTSNGTVAERDFVEGEAAALPDVPVVAAKGDHDTDTTVDQLLEAGVPVPDTEVVEAGGLEVASARDPEFKALFGGLVVNDTGLSPAETGRALREVVDESGSPVVVVLHQPEAVTGYLGFDPRALPDVPGALTTPVDDGIPDLPPGIVTYGHLHDRAGPWVVWNTDTDVVTWTVITQLGTSGGVEENPTFNRFSTPFSAPLKDVSIQLQYVDEDTGLQTGLVAITVAPDGALSIEPRLDLGLAAATAAASGD